MNTNAFKNKYVRVVNEVQMAKLLEIYASLGWRYKNGSYEEALAIFNNSAVDKLTCKDGFVMTSANKEDVMSFDTFVQLINSTSSNPIKTMTATKQPTSNAAIILNNLKAERLFKDEAYVEGLVAELEAVEDVAANFKAVVTKAQDKLNKLDVLANNFSLAISNQDVKSIEKTRADIQAAAKFITETQKILASINDIGTKIVKADAKKDSTSVEEYIGE